MASFVTHDPAFSDIVGPHPTIDLLVEFDDYPFAHEAGVFFEGPETDSLYITSNRFLRPDTQDEQIVRISHVALARNGKDARTATTTVRTEMNAVSEAVPTGNGGVNFEYSFAEGAAPEKAVLFCAQGSRTVLSGLYAMQVAAPNKVQLVLSDFFGRPFNSVNDVVVATTDGAGKGSIWFTDPPYGYEQGYRDRPMLPSQVYRYDPVRKSMRAMADGLGHPNGICFSPDETIVYVTDTDWLHGSGETDMSRASTIYAYDVVSVSGEPFLANRRLFAFADHGIPDGIKCDLHGNVYSGCGDGVHVWSPGGVLLGRIAVEGGAANFCFGRNGEMFLLNETKLWRAQLGSVKGALLGI
ncbi:hypothetical protein SEUCBS140593_003031 [Sporothrix eucalyptigena]|uniref:SMP-30/Gluconolactonase/LRE-like region domain-containing protein n=1 Tax=Sporothrix eucalyptigena TaxID=1812306 RepID=A0ABP0BBC6_9PEZI